MLSRLAYLVTLSLTVFLALLPLPAALAFGRGVGSLCFHVLRLRRAVVLRNLEHTLGDERTEAERRAIAAASYGQFAMTLVEVLRSAAPFRADLRANVAFQGLEPLAAIRDEGRPAICIQAHFGNFDLAAYAFAARGFPHHTVMRSMGNAHINDLIVGVRERYGVTVHQKGKDTAREIREALARGEWVGVLPDQNAKDRGVLVDWIGKPASIFAGPALFQLETGAPLVLAFDERRRDDPRLHDVSFEVLPAPATSPSREEDIRAIMQAVADRVAERVRRRPELYFWMHRLWGKAMHREESAAAAEVAGARA
jgi:KDO2-lipid IV(A) lauroyltransferase